MPKASEHLDTYLVNDRFIFRAIQYRFEILRSEVAHSDALELPFVLELLEDLPQFLQVPLSLGCNEWVVNEVQVGYEAQLVQGALDGGMDVF